MKQSWFGLIHGFVFAAGLLGLSPLQVCALSWQQ